MTIIPPFGIDYDYRHLGLLVSPQLTQDYEDTSEVLQPYSKSIEIESSGHVVPNAVLWTEFCIKWDIDVNLTYGAASISDTVTVDASTFIGNTYLDEIPAIPFTDYSALASSGSDSVLVAITIGSSLNYWESFRKIWIPNIRVTIIANGATASGVFGIGKSENPIGDELPGVTINYCGHTISPFDFGSTTSTALPSGTISIHPATVAGTFRDWKP